MNRRRTLKYRVVSTDKIQEYIMRHHGNHFQKGMPLMFTERIRQAARRLVALPERSEKVGKGWQAVAITKRSDAKPGEDKWVQIPLAPDRGNIMLRLIKHQKEEKKDEAKKMVTVAEKIQTHLNRPRTINGRELVNLPEWKGKYSFDEAGRIWGMRRKTREGRDGLVVQGQEDGRLGGSWAQIQQTKLQKKQMSGVRSAGWQDLLTQNKEIIDILTKERNAIIGVGDSASGDVPSQQ